MTETTGKPLAKKPASPPWLKMTLELGPLILFFFANSRPKLFAPYAHLILPAHLLVGENAGLFTATVVLIPAVLIALVVSYLQLRRLPVMPLVTAILVVIFGALTLYFQDPRFIKMKPTFLYALFGLALLGGLYLKKPILEIVLDNAMPLTEEGWRILTLRWGLFFLGLAILNEIIWRNFSNNVWVAFKFPGIVIIIFLFTIAQVPLMMKHELKDGTAE